MWPTERVTTNQHPDPPAWPIYRDQRDALISLVSGRAPATLTEPVALTPGWSIAQVVAHVCGLTADVASGMRVGLGTPERTEHQVSSRADRTAPEVIEEWRSHAAAMEAAFDEDPFFGHRLTADLTIHLHDVSHSVGAAVEVDGEATRCAAHTYGAVVTDLLRDRTGITMRVELSDGTSFEPTDHQGDTDLVVRATPFDYLRTVTGRRSLAEARALDWTGDPAAALAQICPYGPLRDTDAGF